MEYGFNNRSYNSSKYDRSIDHNRRNGNERSHDNKRSNDNNRRSDNNRSNGNERSNDNTRRSDNKRRNEELTGTIGKYCATKVSGTTTRSNSDHGLLTKSCHRFATRFCTREVLRGREEAAAAAAPEEEEEEEYEELNHSGMIERGELHWLLHGGERHPGSSEKGHRRDAGTGVRRKINAETALLPFLSAHVPAQAQQQKPR